MRFPRTLLAALLAILPLAAQAPRPEPVGLRPDAPTYAKHGPCWVGAREFVVKTPEGRTLAATLWYPALNPKGLKELNTVTMDNAPFGDPNQTFSGHALQDAAPDPAGAPYPLVVFSHGDPGTRADYVPCMEHWASHGFAVLAVDHGKASNTSRITDLKSALDFAQQLASGTDGFAKLIDTSREAASGWSGGGGTALHVGGARTTGLPGETRDPRLKALVLMAPSARVDYLDLGAVTLPVMVLVGAKDDRLNHLQQVYQALPAPRKALVTLTGGTHKIFLDPFLKTIYPQIDWGTLAPDRTQDLIHHFTTAFLLDVLKGDPEAHKALLPEAVKFEEVQYASTW